VNREPFFTITNKARAMVEKHIKIDLNQFKFHLKAERKMELRLHFDSPSRQFYLSVMAFVVHEMQKLGRITSIPLEEHHELLALLNETVGSSVGSSKKNKLLPRIYKKWKGALSNLEDAPLFRVVGKKKNYENGLVRIYQFSDEEKDCWANLFDYKGSGEHVRLQLSLDTLGIDLHDAVILYGEDPELKNEAAWQRFISDLKEKAEEQPKPERAYRPAVREPGALVSQPSTGKAALPPRWKWLPLAAVMVLVAAAAALLAGKYVFYSPKSEFGSGENMAFPLPDKPSIAVLPFVNMSGNPEEEYFSDGITEEIITALSKVENLFVIASSSVFTYKGKAVKAQQVAEDLGVQYVLEGSVRRSVDRLRITAQFVDARNGYHIWGERYDRDLKDLFELQDEITMKIITTLQVTLTEGEQALIAGSGTNNLDAYLKILQARDLARHQSIEDNHKARRFAEEAIALDPGYAQAYRWLAGTHYMDMWLGSAKSPQESLRKAVGFAQKAISMDDSLGGAHGLLGNLYIMRKEYEKGIAEAQRAVELEPNGADAHAFLGMGLRFADRAEEAVPFLQKAIQLDPHASGWYMHALAGAYRNLEKFEEAIKWGEKAVQLNPKNIVSRISLCSIYSQSGLMDKAHEQAGEIMRLNPDFTIEQFARTIPQKNQALKQKFIDALHKAGLK